MEFFTPAIAACALRRNMPNYKINGIVRNRTDGSIYILLLYPL
jgi:acylphosphatase